MAKIDWSQLVTAETRAAQAQSALLTSFEEAVRQHVDATAQKLGYHDGAALAGYVASTVPQWADEAATVVAWRDAIWRKVHAELETAMAAVRGYALPTIEIFIAGLPAMRRR